MSEFFATNLSGNRNLHRWWDDPARGDRLRWLNENSKQWEIMGKKLSRIKRRNRF